MSELERVGRLPVFIDEEQWSAAYEAAYHELQVIVETTGKALVPRRVMREVATRIATAALRAASCEDSGDIGDLPGVHVDEIGSQTDTVTSVSDRDSPLFDT